MHHFPVDRIATRRLRTEQELTITRPVHVVTRDSPLQRDDACQVLRLDQAVAGTTQGAGCTMLLQERTRHNGRRARNQQAGQQGQQKVNVTLLARFGQSNVFRHTHHHDQRMPGQLSIALDPAHTIRPAAVDVTPSGTGFQPFEDFGTAQVQPRS